MEAELRAEPIPPATTAGQLQSMMTRKLPESIRLSRNKCARIPKQQEACGTCGTFPNKVWMASKLIKLRCRLRKDSSPQEQMRQSKAHTHLPFSGDRKGGPPRERTGKNDRPRDGGWGDRRERGGGGKHGRH